MAGRRLTTTDLIEEVRSLLDESNRANVSDELDILPALNRAQDVAANILARHYEAPLLAYKSLQLTQGQSEYEIPEDAFEQRLEKCEVYITSVYYPVKRIDYRDITLYETPTRTNVPYYYTVIGTKFRLLPTPTAVYPMRIWYLKDPEALVQPQGRITVVNTAQNYVVVDEIGSDITSAMDDLNSFVNIIDGQTGKVKGTLQVQTIAGNRITFKTSPSRSTVLNKTISSDLANLPDGTVEPDDYLCVIQGTCIPVFKKPFSNYLIQFAVAEIQRKLGGPADIELKVRDELEKIVERSWVGRENFLRVQKRNRNWQVPSRRYFNNN
jgi:hypothetical protein